MQVGRSPFREAAGEGPRRPTGVRSDAGTGSLTALPERNLTIASEVDWEALLAATYPNVPYTPPSGWVEPSSDPAAAQTSHRFHTRVDCPRVRHPDQLRQSDRPYSATRCPGCAAEDGNNLEAGRVRAGDLRRCADESAPVC